MLNSLLLFFATNNRNKFLPLVATTMWILVYILKTDFEYGVMFPMICMLTFALVSILISKLSKGKLNTVLSITSILIWSVIVDTICYFVFPEYAMGGIFAYIFKGIVFNFKYVIVNIAAYLGVIITETALDEAKNKQKIK